MDFLCNQFGHQTLEPAEEIAGFCDIKFGITLKHFSKIKVNGKNEASFYQFLKNQQGGVLNANIKWKFTKFLVDKNGNVVKRFESKTTSKKYRLILRSYYNKSSILKK